jgi:hypothetical protein
LSTALSTTPLDKLELSSGQVLPAKNMTEFHAISSLQQRYGLASRQAVYDRIKALSIEPVSRGKLIDRQIEQLDALNEWLKLNPNSPIADFPQQPEVINHQSLVISHQPSEPAAIEHGRVAANLADDRENFLELIEAIARHISATRDPLQHYAALERAIASGWLLSSSEVRSLIGVKPCGDRFVRGSFIFIRAGKIGNQASWRVAKVIEGGSYRV